MLFQLSYGGKFADDGAMSDDRVGEWWSEQPRRPPAEYATLLARKRVWRDVQRSFVVSVPDLWDVDVLLELDVELAHALVFVLAGYRQPSDEGSQTASTRVASAAG